MTTPMRVNHADSRIFPQSPRGRRTVIDGHIGVTRQIGPGAGTATNGHGYPIGDESRERIGKSLVFLQISE